MAPSSTSRHEDESPEIATTENTPLLTANGAQSPTETAQKARGLDGEVDGHGQDEDRPLPLDQILLLCYTRLVEPIAFFSIFPYINKMIYETGGIQTSDVGFYSGLIESLFSLTQMCVMIFWGWVRILSNLFPLRLTGEGCRLPRTKTCPGVFVMRSDHRDCSIWNKQDHLADDSI